MPPKPKRTAWTARRRRGAAIQLLLGGVLLMGVPAFLGESPMAAGFRTLSPIAWLMAVAGAVLLLFLREDRSRPSDGVSAKPSGAVPLHPDPVKPRTRELRPLQRPTADPLRPYEDTEGFSDSVRR